MNLHDDLTHLLEAEVSDVTPSPELWDRVRTGVTHRDARRWWVRGGLGLVATAAAVAAALVVTQLPGDRSTPDGPVSNPTPPAPSSGADSSSAEGELEFIWPYTSTVEMDAAAASARARYADPAATARLFVAEYVRLEGATVATTPHLTNRYRVSVAGRDVGSVGVVKLQPKAPKGMTVYVVESLFPPEGSRTYVQTTTLTSGPAWIGGTLDAGVRRLELTLHAGSSPEPTAEGDALVDGDHWQARLDYGRITGQEGGVVVVARDEAGAVRSVHAIPVAFDHVPPDAVSPLPSGAPREAYGVAPDGAIVLVALPSGQVKRTLVRPAVGATVGKLALSPDGTKLYYALSTAPCESSIYVVPTPGGAPSVISRGSVASIGKPAHAQEDPAISPDGRRLAYAHSVCDGNPADGRTSSELVVDDLATRDVWTWPAAAAPADGGTDSVAHPVWSVDGRRVGVLYNPCCGDDDRELRSVDVVDVSATPDLSKITPAGPRLLVASDHGPRGPVLLSQDGIGEFYGDGSPTRVADLDGLGATGFTVDDTGNHFAVSYEVNGVRRVALISRGSDERPTIAIGYRGLVW